MSQLVADAKNEVEGMTQQAKGNIQKIVGKAQMRSDDLGEKMKGAMNQGKGAMNDAVGQIKRSQQ